MTNCASKSTVKSASTHGALPPHQQNHGMIQMPPAAASKRRMSGLGVMPALALLTSIVVKLIVRNATTPGL